MRHIDRSMHTNTQTYGHITCISHIHSLTYIHTICLAGPVGKDGVCCHRTSPSKPRVKPPPQLSFTGVGGGWV